MQEKHFLGDSRRAVLDIYVMNTFNTVGGSSKEIHLH